VHQNAEQNRQNDGAARALVDELALIMQTSPIIVVVSLREGPEQQRENRCPLRGRDARRHFIPAG
jgi:hypothetical protein